MVSTNNKRKEKDLMKLMMTNYEVTLTEENNQNDFFVVFKGPKDSPYEEGSWKVHVLLPDQYPFKSPSIGFMNKIYHPNVDEASGTVCLDVINQAWSPMFELVNIFDAFLPQLLQDPNPKDPLNGEAAQLLLKDPEKYKLKVKEYVKKYAGNNKSIAVTTGQGSSLAVTNGTSNKNGPDAAVEEAKSEHSELSNASDYHSD